MEHSGEFLKKFLIGAQHEKSVGIFGKQKIWPENRKSSADRIGPWFWNRSLFSGCIDQIVSRLILLDSTSTILICIINNFILALPN